MKNTMKVKAAVAWKAGEPLKIEIVDNPTLHGRMWKM